MDAGIASNVGQTKFSVTDNIKEQRQIIRYRATATIRRPQTKQYTASNEGGGVVTKPTGKSYNIDKVWSGAPDFNIKVTINTQGAVKQRYTSYRKLA